MKCEFDRFSFGRNAQYLSEEMEFIARRNRLNGKNNVNDLDFDCIISFQHISFFAHFGQQAAYTFFLITFLAGIRLNFVFYHSFSTLPSQFSIQNPPRHRFKGYDTISDRLIRIIPSQLVCREKASNVKLPEA